MPLDSQLAGESDYKYFKADQDAVDVEGRKEICKLLELPEKFAIDVEE